MLGLSSLAAVLLMATASPLADPPAAPHGPVSLDAGRVHRAAVDHAPIARLLDEESRTLCCGIDPDDPAARAQVGLIQTALGHLADHQRNLAAEEALVTYFQIVGLEDQAALLDAADRALDQLAAIAERAGELGIAGANPLDIERQRLDLEDRRLERETTLERLRLRLAGAIGRDRSTADRIVPSEPLEVRFEAVDAEQAVREGLQNRSDLRALRAVCQCMSDDALPAARQLLGVVQPGLGLAPDRPPSPALLATLRHAHRRPSDLNCRRRQCHSLLHAREDQVDGEIRDASARLDGAYRRADLAKKQVELAERRVRRAQRAAELGQPSGSVPQSEIERVEAKSEYYRRLVEAREAEIRWAAAQGRLASP